MKRMNVKKSKLTSANLGLIHDNAPADKTYLSNKKLIGTVIARTKTTATPRPNDVLTFLDTARYEHIPKKYANIILSINIERMKILNDSIISYPPLVFVAT